MKLIILSCCLLTSLITSTIGAPTLVSRLNSLRPRFNESQGHNLEGLARAYKRDPGRVWCYTTGKSPLISEVEKKANDFAGACEKSKTRPLQPHSTCNNAVAFSADKSTLIFGSCLSTNRLAMDCGDGKRAVDLITAKCKDPKYPGRVRGHVEYSWGELAVTYEGEQEPMPMDIKPS